jgi:hypothetical protein
VCVFGVWEEGEENIIMCRGCCWKMNLLLVVCENICHHEKCKWLYKCSPLALHVDVYKLSLHANGITCIACEQSEWSAWVIVAIKVL